jgi:hypothetical protein
MKNVGIFFDRLEYFTAIWYNLWPFGIACGHLLYFSKFGTFGSRKIWQPWSRSAPDSKRSSMNWSMKQAAEEKAEIGTSRHSKGSE